MASKNPEGWLAKLSAQIGSEKGQGLFGIVPNTRLQLTEPPSPPEPQGIGTVKVLFLKEGKTVTADIKAQIGQRAEWDVVVVWNAEQVKRDRVQVNEVSLTFDGVGYAPKDVALWLLDTATGKRLYMRTQNVYRFTPQEGETSRRFKIVAELGNDHPLRIVGLKATPLRGQGLVLEFSLTKPAKVTAEVLTLTGRKVAVLESQAPREAGTQRIMWRGTRSDGSRLTRGIYLIRLVAADDEGRQVQAVATAQVQ